MRAGDLGAQFDAGRVELSDRAGRDAGEHRLDQMARAGAEAPFSPDRFFRFRKYWDYSGGIATDLFFHSLGPILYPMGAQFPTRVSAGGGIYVHKDREVPDTYTTTIEYPNFYIEMSGSMANAAMGRTTGRRFTGTRGRWWWRAIG